jgi:dienelactone hydrolase
LRRHDDTLPPAIRDFPRLAERDAFLLLLNGDADAVASPADLEIMRAALQDCGARFEIVVYPNVGHGFDCAARPNDAAAASEDAWRRVGETLARTLGPQPVGSL